MKEYQSLLHKQSLLNPQWGNAGDKANPSTQGLNNREICGKTETGVGLIN